VPRATGERSQLSSYEEAWEAINRLVRAGGSWSGEERNCFYANSGAGTFANASAASGLDLADDGRGLAVWDFDRDGDPDLLVKNRTGPQLRIWRNDSAAEHSRIQVRLEGTRSNRQAVGAKVRLRVGATRRVKELRAGSAFLSQDSAEIFFGLGEAKQVDQLEVVWPSGLRQSFADLPVDRRYRLREGDREVRTEPFAPRSAVPSSSNSPAVASEGRPGADGSSASGRRLWLLDPAVLPELSFRDGGGRMRRWRDFAGAPFVVNLWTPECSTCAGELKTWAEARKVRPHSLDLVALAPPGGDEGRSALRAAERAGLRACVAEERDFLALALLLEEAALWPRRLPVPTTLLVDERGRAVRLYEGEVSWTDLEADAAARPRDLPGRMRLALPFPGRYYESALERSDFELGVAYLAEGFVEHALPAFERVLERRPGDVEASYNAGVIHLRMDRLEEAEGAFSAALAGSPEFADARANLAVVAARRGDLERAESFLLEVLAARPDHAEALLNLGNLELARGDASAALERFRAASAAAPHLSAVHERLGVALRRLGDVEGARQALERAAGLDPRNAELWSNLGVVLAECGRLEDADKTLRRALDVDSRCASALNNHGLVLGAMGKPEPAEAAFRKAVEVEAGSPAPRLNLARLYLRSGKRKLARQVLEDLVAACGEHPEAMELLETLGR
jgi:Flp pilus assembly protein TadD